MAKQSITNMSPGVRSLNCIGGKTPDGKTYPLPTALLPGETADLELFNAEDAVFKGMVKSGELLVGDEGTKPELPADKLARLEAESGDKAEAARKAGYDDGYAKGLEDGKAAAKTKA